MRSSRNPDPRTVRGTPVTIATPLGGTWTGVVLRPIRAGHVRVRVTSAPRAVAHVIGHDRDFPIRELTPAPLFEVVHAN